MHISTDPNVWIIYGLVFLLGILVGLFMTAGGRKKWKTRYYDETARHDALQKEHKERTRDWETREKELLDRPLVAPVVAVAPVAAVAATRTRRPAAGLVDKVLGRDRDRDGDGIADRDEVTSRKIDRNDDGIDDRDQ